MPIKAITFDYWNTLFREVNSAARQEIRISAFSKMTRVPKADVAEALTRVWEEFSRCHRQEQRTLGPADAVRLAAEMLDVQIDPPVARALADVFATAVVVYSPVPIDGAFEAVKAAAERVPIGIISDTGVSPGASLQYILDRHGFTPYFRALSYSDQVGVAKPQRAIFELTAQALGVQLDELLHIGDLEHTDVTGAQALGSKAALFTGVNATHADDTVADYVFTTWQDFLDVLDELV